MILHTHEGCDIQQRKTLNELSKEEVEKFINQAEELAEADKKKKEEIELKNETDAIIYATEKMLKERRDRISQDKRLKIEQMLSDAKEAIKESDIDRIKKSKEDLIKAPF